MATPYGNPSSPEKEVIHNEGVTRLFAAIEEAEWRDALDISEEHPEQVRTWVRSTGTENTTFEWSMWRRLPIHEACRRQAPVWLVSSLLSAFPESAYMTTKYDALPLHLAIEFGTTPEVVNLLVVANWSAIVTPDQSGRIPTDILDRNELLQLDEHRIIHESLTRCYKAYTSMQKAAQEEQSLIKRHHKAQFTAISKRHQDELKREGDKQEEIREEVRYLESIIEDMKVVEEAKDHQLRKFQQEKIRWMDHVDKLEEIAEDLTKKLEVESEKVKALLQTIEEKDKDIETKEARIELLSNDVRDISVMYDGEVMDSLIATEESMRVMVSNQIGLQKHLAGQANGLKALLRTRGIPMPEELDIYGYEEEGKYQHPEETMGTRDAAEAVVVAAMAALQKPPVGTV